MANTTRKIVIEFDAKLGNVDAANKIILDGFKAQGEAVDTIKEKIVNYATKQKDAAGNIIVAQKAVQRVTIETSKTLEEVDAIVKNLATDANNLGVGFLSYAKVVASSLNSAKKSAEETGKEIVAINERTGKAKEQVAKHALEVEKATAKDWLENERAAVKSLQSIWQDRTNQLQKSLQQRAESYKTYANTVTGVEQKLADTTYRINKELQDKLHNYATRLATGQISVKQANSYADKSIGKAERDTTTAVNLADVARDLIQRNEARKVKDAEYNALGAQYLQERQRENDNARIIQQEWNSYYTRLGEQHLADMRAQQQLAKDIQAGWNKYYNKLGAEHLADIKRQQDQERDIQAGWKNYYASQATAFRTTAAQQEEITNRTLELERLALQRNGGQRAVLLQQQANHEIDLRRNYANTISLIERQIATGSLTTSAGASQAAIALGQMETALRSSRTALEEHLQTVGGNTRETQNLGIRVLEMIGLYRLWSSLINTVISGLRSIPAAGIEMQATISALHASFSANPSGGALIETGIAEQQTAEAMAMLRAEADRTGISILTLEKNYRTFLASAHLAGESTATVNSIFKDLNTTISALHLSGDRAELTFLALSQMFNKGKIQSEELVKQLGNLLPGAFASFAEANGKSTEELVAQMKSGAVRAHETVQKFIAYYAKNYADAFNIAAQGLNANLGRLDTAWTQFARSLFIATQDIMSDFVNLGTTILKSITPSEETLIKWKNWREDLKGILTFGIEQPVSQAAPKSIESQLTNAGKYEAKIAEITAKTQELWKWQNQQVDPQAADLFIPGLAAARDGRIEQLKGELQSLAKEFNTLGLNLTKDYTLMEKEGKNFDEVINGNMTKITEYSHAAEVAYSKIYTQLQVQREAQKKQSNADAEGFVPQGDEGLSKAEYLFAMEKAYSELHKAELKAQIKEETQANKAIEEERTKRKEILQNSLAELKDTVAKEAEAFRQGNNELDADFKSGNGGLSLQQYYDRKKTIQEEYSVFLEEQYAKEIAVIREQIAIEKDLLNTGKSVAATMFNSPEVTSGINASMAKYAEFVRASAKANGVPEAILFAMMGQESEGKAGAVSPKNALGLMQTKESTFQEVMGLGNSNFFDPKDNIEAGARYFKKLFDSFTGQKEQFLKALAAYNAGPGRIGKDIRQADALGVDWKTLIPNETKGYITSVPARLEKLGISQESIAKTTEQNTALAETSKHIIELEGRERDLTAAKELAILKTNEETAAVQKLAAEEIKRINEKYLTPDEKYDIEITKLNQLRIGIEGVRLSQSAFEKDSIAAAAKRDKDKQELALSSLKKKSSFEEYKLSFDDKAFADGLQRAKDLAIGLKDAFGGVGEAIGGLIESTAQYGKTLNDIDTQRQHSIDLAAKETLLTNDPKEKAQIAKNLTQLEITYTNQARQAELKKYGDITNSAKLFFKEGTTGYAAMQNATRVFRAFEVAQSLYSTLFQKEGILQTVAAWVTGEASKTAATEAGAATQIATNAAVGTSTAVAGVANQSLGDPYTAFARMAAMAAIMATLGFAVGGFGSKKADVDYAKLTQENTGTGSILGDSKAKSESIAKSIELLATNSSLDLPISNAMLTSLKNIEGGINGLAAFGAQQGWFNTKNATAGISTGLLSDGGASSAFGLGSTAISTGIGFASGFAGAALATPGAGIAGGLAAGLLGGAASLGIGLAISLILNALGIKAFGRDKSISDFGITSNIAGTDYNLKHDLAPANRGANFVDMGQTIADISANKVNLAKYIDTKVEETIFFFGHKERNWREGTEQKVGGEVQDQITKLIIGTADSLKTAAKYLEPNLTGIEDNINNFVFRLGDISFKGKDGADRTAEEIQKDLNAAFSKNFDGMAQAALKGLEPFQKVGEGYYQTLIRVASGQEQAQAAANALYLGQIVNYKEIINKQGDVAVEGLRDTILKLEKDGDGSFSGLGKIMQTFQGTISEEVDLYRALIQVRKDLKAVGQKGTDVSTDLIVGAGGLSPLQAGLSDYRDKILDPVSQFKAYSNEIQDTFKKIGVAVPETNSQLSYLLDTITDPKLKGAVIAQIPNLLHLQDLAGNATAARESTQSFGLSLAETDNLIYNLTGQFGSLDNALNKTSDIIDTFTNKADAAQTARDLQEKALKDMPELKKLGLGVGTTQETANSIIRSLGYANVQALIADFNANGIGDKDPRLQYLHATGALSAATKTTAQDNLDAANKAATDAADKAAKNAADFSKLLIDINQELATLGKSDVAKGLANINNQLKDLTDKASAAGGTIANLADISKAKTMEFLKPTLKEYNNRGKSDIQIAIEEANTWRTEWLDAANDIAVKTGVPLEEVKTMINSLGDQKYINAIKSASSALKDFKTTIADYVKTLEHTAVGTPFEQFKATQRDAIDIYNRAINGDQEAMGKLQGIASEYISAIDANYGSSDYGQSLKAQVVAALKDAPAQLTLQEVIEGTAKAQLKATEDLPGQIATAIAAQPILASGNVVIPTGSALSSNSTTVVTSLETALAEMKAELVAIKNNQVAQVNAITSNDISLNNKLIETVSGSSEKTAKTIAYSSRTKVELV